jgi:small-conductance mechanosensitive channel
LILHAALASSAEETHPLIQRAEDNLQSAREIAATVTNEQEKVVWQRRIELSEKELENARHRVELEEKEKVLLEAQSRLGARHALKEALRSIDIDVPPMEKRGRELDGDLRKKQGDRSELAEKVDRPAENEQDIQDKAEDQQRLQQMDNELRILALQRDTIDLRIRLAQEALRIDQQLRDQELNPRPTIRRILDMRRQTAAAEKGSGDFRTVVTFQTRQRESVAESRALAQQRFENLDQEIKTLESLYESGRRFLFGLGKQDTPQAERQKRLWKMLADSRSQRRHIQERLEALDAQLAALDEGIALANRCAALIDAEYNFQKHEQSELVRRFFQRITAPTALVVGLIVLHLLVRSVILPLFLKSENRFVARRASAYITGLLVVAVLALFFLEDLKAIATILGIAGAAVVIALQDLCSAFAGWFVIITSRKIQVGDRIEVDGHRGDVVDIQLLRTTLLEIGNWMGSDEPTGRIVVIPNSFIFKSQFFNYSHMHPYIWGKVDITVTFESPIQSAHEVLLRALTEATREDFAQARSEATTMHEKYGVADAVYEPRVISTLSDHGVRFSLFYVCHYRHDDETRHRVAQRVLEALEKEPRIRPAYPTQRELNEPSPVSYAKGQHA